MRKRTLITALIFIAISSLFTISLYGQQGKKPVIGISSTWGEGVATSVPLTYVESVIRAGGVPVVLPLTQDTALISNMLDRIDGLIMTGGEDLDPLRWYGEEPVQALGQLAPERDSFDIALVRMAISRGLPVLGICRGHQLLNVAFGGTLYQDIPSQIKSSNINHNQKAPRYHGTHSIQIEKGSLLHKQTGLEKVSVNSYHHQAVKDIASGFRITARSPDGVVEAIEKIGSTKIYGVQFHPEGFTANGIDTFLGIFQHLINEAAHRTK